MKTGWLLFAIGGAGALLAPKAPGIWVVVSVLSVSAFLLGLGLWLVFANMVVVWWPWFKKPTVLHPANNRSDPARWRAEALRDVWANSGRWEFVRELLFPGFRYVVWVEVCALTVDRRRVAGHRYDGGGGYMIGVTTTEAEWLADTAAAWAIRKGVRGCHEDITRATTT